MSIYDGFTISISGMDAQLRRLRLIASNMANANSTRADGGEPYRRKDIVFEAVPLEQGTHEFPRAEEGLQKVVTAGIVQDNRPFKRAHMPGHPDADEQGFVLLPNVEPFEEMINMMDAIRSYEANVTTFNASKDMIKKALEM
jgi:flagellar basal-body rod protein FlgC